MPSKILEGKPSKTGMGAFAKTPIPAGTIIVDWTHYPLCTMAELPNPYVEDRHVQVARDLFVGCCGPDEPDDFINHSCEPNARIVVALPQIHVVALRGISKGEEVTFDYSETMCGDPWEMECRCGMAACRGIIREL